MKNYNKPTPSQDLLQEKGQTVSLAMKKKLGALILSSAAVFGASACDSDPVQSKSPSEYTSVEFETPTANSSNTTESASGKYIPQYDKYSNRSTLVDVNGEMIDVAEYISDPYVREVMFTSHQISRMTRHQYMTGEAIYNAPVHLEDIKATMSVEEAKGIEKDYKILDESATDQEILDNFDIEIVSSVKAKDEQTTRSTLLYTLDSEVYDSWHPFYDIYYATGSEEKAISHRQAENPDNNINTERQYYLGRTSKPVSYKNWRLIPFKSSNDEYALGMFHYTDFGGIKGDAAGISKWMMAEMVPYDKETYLKEFADMGRKDDILDRYSK